jgi:hypothetical protein
MAFQEIHDWGGWFAANTFTGKIVGWKNLTGI